MGGKKEVENDDQLPSLKTCLKKKIVIPQISSHPVLI